MNFLVSALKSDLTKTLINTSLLFFSFKAEYSKFTQKNHEKKDYLLVQNDAIVKTMGPIGLKIAVSFNFGNFDLK